MKSVVVYSSMTGATKGVAEALGLALGATVMEASDADAAAFEGCDLLVLGASTWGLGDLEDGMVSFLETFKSMDLTIPKGAVFGVGDMYCYADTFVDGIADMADALESKGIARIGDWSTDGYMFDASRAQSGDHFVGLALDQDNEADKTPARLSAWVEQLKKEAASY